jgi:polysaccharide biosynthesis transport protein
MLTPSSQPAPLPLGRAGKPLDIVGFATRFGLLVLALGAFVFCLLAPVVLLLSRPNYDVQASLKIDPVVPSLITKSEDPSIINYFHDYARTQAQRMKAFEVLAETIQRLSPQERAAVLPESLAVEETVAILKRIIRITPVHRTHLVSLSVSGPKPEGLAPLLNHHMAVFLEKTRREAELRNRERLTYLEKKRAALQGAIDGMEKQLQTLSESIHTASFSEDFNVLQQQSQQLQQLTVQAFGERVFAEKAYQQSRRKAEQLRALSLDPMVDEVVMKDQSIDFTSSWTYQQLQQLRSSIDGITTENPDRIRVEKRMQAMREYELQLRREVRDTAEKILHGKREYELERELTDAHKKLEAAREAEADIRDALATSQQQASRISKGLIEGEALGQQLNHSRDLLFRIDTRIHELMAESKAPLRISIESPARKPLAPTGSNTKKLLILCLVVAFGGVGGALLAYDVSDNRIRSPRNIQHALGHPPTWPLSRAGDGIPFSQLLAKAPHSQPAKAIRSLAIRLNRERERSGARVFLFTGVDTGTGCSGITLNCAQALTELAPKVLVVEGNREHPQLARTAGRPLPADGLTPLLAGLTPYAGGIVHDPERGVDLLPIHNDTFDKSSRHRLHAFIRQARDHYDAICIDAAPIRQCDLAEYLAVQADAVALISQGDSTMVRDLFQSAEILVRLEVPAIAPVLNWGGTKKNARVDQVLDNLPGIGKRLATHRRKKAGERRNHG